MSGKRGGFLAVVCGMLLMLAMVVPLPGCAGSVEERRAVFDESIKTAETEKVKAQALVDERIAQVKAAFDQQAAALEKEIARLQKLSAEAATPQAAEEVGKQLDAVKAIEAKANKVFDETVGKFEKVTQDVSARADALIASLKAEREKIISVDPGQQISGTGKVIGDAVGGKEGFLVTIISGLVGGLVTGIWKQKQLAAEQKKRSEEKAVAVEAIGTMSQVITAGLIPMSDEAADVLNKVQSQKARDLVDEADAFYRDTIKIAEAALKVVAKPQAA